MELMIVVVIITILYGFSASSFNFSLSPKPQPSLLNIRSILLSQSFVNETSLTCLEDENECMIIVDGNVVKKIPSMFDNDNPPTAYTYSLNYEEIHFKEYQIDEFDSKPILFQLTLTKGGLKQEMIVENKQKAYIFNSLFDVPVVVEDIGGVYEYFTNRANEIREAF